MDKPALPVVQQQQARIDSVEGIRLATIKFMGRVYPSESLPASNIFIISGSCAGTLEEVAAVCIFRARNPCRGAGLRGTASQGVQNGFRLYSAWGWQAKNVLWQRAISADCPGPRHTPFLWHGSRAGCPGVAGARHKRILRPVPPTSRGHRGHAQLRLTAPIS